MKSHGNYSDSWLPGQVCLSLMLLFVLLAGAGQARSAELLVDSGAGNAGSLHWETLSLAYLDPGSADGTWSAQVDGLRLAFESRADLALGTLEIECPLNSGAASGLPCLAGQFVWQRPDQGALSGAFRFDPEVTRPSLDIELESLGLALRWSKPEAEAASLNLELDELILARLPELRAWLPGLDLLDGRIDGQASWIDGRLQGSFRVAALDFDGFEGRLAGAGLLAAIELEGQLDASGWALETRLTQSGGELLADALYLPPPEAPLELEIELASRAADRIEIRRLSLDDPEILSLRAVGWAERDESGWRLASLEAERIELDLARAWPRWFEGHAAAAGFAGLEAQGRVEAGLRLEQEGLTGLTARLAQVGFQEPDGRFGLAGLSGVLEFDQGVADLALELAGLELLGLPFGPGRLRAASDRSGLSLSEPFRLPLLDGALVIDRLKLNDRLEERGIELDARIEPIDLVRLTALLGFPSFGGTLAGAFPGIRVGRERLAFTGGIDIEAFEGRIRLDELVVERPFGTLPALAAQVRFDRLDLLELTGAFNFGRMEGQVSGWMRDLRLLDWRPVAMNTRIYTHEDAPRRRISQRAVDNLSSLGGGVGGALLSGTVLRVFEDFPYRRAGLACRLSNNICHVDGVAPHESGGFYIVEGRGVPRLDIIGHRRLVDWPQLLAQLRAATRGR
ncbi:hypothetical protein [Wenzhouxiangella marina]|uniref:Uncharacterized protein n=1 Tax=Wenzhouxiangella marina TaxID=1579979 RepID=A0A0K0XXM5_9GAMM|nr:hypothetical protein [Wenzhouxiangella marina]AKS42433.1 hypothetical protein WM2015_2068 [Wenzhouxiangella marina]MBB6085793.1 hypothetical protein [Wenzhouxiangella marina]